MYNTSGLHEYIGRNKDTRFEIEIDRKVCRANTKKRLAFTNRMESNSLFQESISETKDGVRADLRGGAGVTEYVDFRNTKNSGEDGIIANVRNSAGTKGIVDFRGTIIAGGTNVNRFSPKSINLIASLVDIE